MLINLIPTNQFKANLHCHSTHSDGKLTPEMLKECYKKQGYSILAYSDHNVLIPHTDLKDDAFLPITSTEIDLTEPSDNWLNARTYHLNFFSKDENRTSFIPVNRVYDPAVINDLIKRATDEGFIAQYNHPRWSLQKSEDYLPLKGLTLTEVYNTGCEKEMRNGYGEVEYEIMLRNGMFPAPSATDDNHNAASDCSSPYSDSFGGFNMIFAEKLEYGAVLHAIGNKQLYASTGPLFTSVVYSTDNNTVCIKSSPCCTVACRTESRASRCNLSHGDDITYTEFDLSFGYKWKYVRFELTDSAGRKAFTKAYKYEDLITNK